MAGGRFKLNSPGFSNDLEFDGDGSPESISLDSKFNKYRTFR